MLILFKTVNTKDWWSFFHHVKVMSVFTEKDKGIQICEKRTLMYKLMNGYMHLNKSTKRNLMVWSTFSNFRNAVCITKTLECRQQMNVFSLSRDSLISLNLISVAYIQWKNTIFFRGAYNDLQRTVGWAPLINDIFLIRIFSAILFSRGLQ